MRWLAAAASWLALSVACHGDDWIIGGELPREPDPASGEGDNPELGSEPDACPSSLQMMGQRQQQFASTSVEAAHVGRWRGQLGGGASGFPGPELELEIDASGAGTLFFAASPGDRVVSDIDTGYLCSAEAMGVVCGSDSGFVGSFEYPIAGARSRDGVLSFVIVTADPWGGWCAEHVPVSWEDPDQPCGVAFGVLPEAQLHYSALGCSRVTPDGAESIDCALMYALEYCQCARDACFARFDRSVEVGLTLSEDGTELSGSLWYESGRDAAPLTLTGAP